MAKQLTSDELISLNNKRKNLKSLPIIEENKKRTFFSPQIDK